ncbi:alpha/beta fold hydrolase [Bacillus seohaeanensis]|jgi:proline iminopeptidase|uniref:Alpha/beta fold hydrolase n=1 Tax=Bacillus seohaeanensis TaxID=284580 RepID=A0ABW5RPA5_9BACI
MSWDCKQVKTSRGSFEIFIKGKGKPICITHLYSEFNETGDLFADCFTDEHMVILINLRGCGNSEKAHSPFEYSMIHAVLDLEAIREALMIKRWSFAGHSTGGMLGVLYGVYFSERLNDLLIVGAAARDYTVSRQSIYNREHPLYNKMQWLLEELKRPGLQSNERLQLKKDRTKLSLYAPELHDEYFPTSVKKKMSSLRLNYFSTELAVFDLTRKLERISVRTLIICGRHDVQCPVSFSIEMEEAIPQASLLIFEKSNHYPFLEERELFIRGMKSFFNG